MFKRRGRVSATTAVDLPYCAMCGGPNRVDVASGRCGLGHRVAVATGVAPTPEVTDPAQAATPFDDFVSDRITTFGTQAPHESLAAAHAEATQAWDNSTTQPVEGFDDFLAWDEPTDGLSALDVDTNELPVAADPVDPAPVASTTSTLSDGLLDELDDAAHARRRTVGTIGATIAVTGAVFGAVALLPF
jgi:hypothetical protein